MPDAMKYLDLAARIVDEAAANWFRADGTYHDPYEPRDRWAGGCAARFVCPGAILVSRGGRGDLLPLVADQMDRLCRAVEGGRGQPGHGWPPGVFDLVSKEIQVAFRELRGRVAAERWNRWRAALAGIAPESAYTGTGKLRVGKRPTNYEIYASVAEWLRYREGLTGSSEWLETMLAASQPLFTGQGMYRDPGDPMTYDLSVRQNLAELLHYGYDGPHAEVAQRQLARAGLVTLQMASPLGYAPYGGRSNHFVHNEAMLAYVCEFEARRWRQRDAGLAARYRALAHQARGTVAEFVELSPPRNLKNRFAPSSKFGRDAGYGEYGVYSLLGASLLARIFLVADDTIPVAERWAENGSLYLAPAFHRLFAIAGDTGIELDTRGQVGYDAIGIGRFHRRGVPAPLGGSLSIAANPKCIAGECATDRNVAIGPGWRGEGGSWEWLADCSDRAGSVEMVGQRVGEAVVEWELVHTVEGKQVRTVRQRFCLRAGGLAIEVEVSPDVAETGFAVPFLQTDGESRAALSWFGAEAAVEFCGAVLRARVSGTERGSVDPVPRASREAVYGVMEFGVPGSRARLELELGPS